MFHIGRGELRRGEEAVHLTDRERDMLRMLAAAPGETVTRLALAGNGASPGERAVDVQVNRLRRKIEVDPANPLLVQTVRGIGYRLMVRHDHDRRRARAPARRGAARSRTRGTASPAGSRA